MGHMTFLTGHDVTVVDGGMSNALEERGHDLASDLWTARLLLDDPGEVAAVHADYYRAGADVATTATYQASVPGLVAAGLDRRRAEATIRAGVRVARDVRDELAGELGRELLVAASVGPYGAYLADGSEYRGRYGVPAATLRDFHARRLELLAEAGPDLLAVETVPDADEAEVLVPLLEEIGLPAWFSYAVEGSATRAGQPLREAYAVVAGCAPLVAVGVNCSSPRDVAGALTTARDVTGRAGLAYPNLGERWDNDTHSWVGEGEFDVALAPGWVAAGARFVGGCCRVGPDRIASLRAALASGA
jgi:homocysteine S-methyltransferase